MFNLQLLPITDMESTKVGDKKFYKSPMGLLPSVTTVLGAQEDKSYLEVWRKRIGDQAADQIVQQARHLGNSIHLMCEKYTLNDETWAKESTINKLRFKNIKQILDKNITKVMGVELPLWSSILKAAGTTDLFAEWNGKLTIVDYKTSRRLIKENSNKLQTYKLQAATYSLMIYERYGIKVPGCVILVILPHDEPQVISFETTQYYKKVIEIFRNQKVL